MHPSSQMLSFMGTTWLSFLAACEWNTTRQVAPVMRCYKLVWNLILHYLTLLRTTINQAVNPVLNQLRVFVCEAPRHFDSKLERFGVRTFPAGRQLQESLGSLPQGAQRAAVLGPATGRCCWSRWRPGWVRHGHDCRVKERHTSITRTCGIYIYNKYVINI